MRENVLEEPDRLFRHRQRIAEATSDSQPRAKTRLDCLCHCPSQGYPLAVAGASRLRKLGKGCTGPEQAASTVGRVRTLEMQKTPAQFPRGIRPGLEPHKEVSRESHAQPDRPGEPSSCRGSRIHLLRCLRGRTTRRRDPWPRRRTSYGRFRPAQTVGP